MHVVPKTKTKNTRFWLPSTFTGRTHAHSAGVILDCVHSAIIVASLVYATRTPPPPSFALLAGHWCGGWWDTEWPSGMAGTMKSNLSRSLVSRHPMDLKMATTSSVIVAQTPARHRCPLAVCQQNGHYFGGLDELGCICPCPWSLQMLARSYYFLHVCTLSCLLNAHGVQPSILVVACIHEGC